jgi:hypothetical protein
MPKRTYYLSRTSFGRRFARGAKRSRPAPPRKRGLRARALTQSKKYNLHHYKRWATPANISLLGPMTASSGSFVMSLSDVRNPSELTALYDQYKITGVKIRFKLTSDPNGIHRTNTVMANSANIYPKLLVVRDYDDNATETPNEMRERNNTKMYVLRPNSFIDIFIRPAVRNQLYLDGVTTASSPLWGQWLDCSSTQVPHYGIKYSLDYEGFNISQQFDLSIEKCYYISFKNAR